VKKTYPQIIAVRLTDRQLERYRRLAQSRRRPLSSLIRIVLDEECDIAEANERTP